MKLFTTQRIVTIDCETLNAINEIARQLKRLADAWEGGNSTNTEKDGDDKYNRVWTDADIEKAIALYNEGKTLQEIADSFPGRTPDGVYCALIRRGINIKKREKKNVDYPVIQNTAKPKRPYNRKDMWSPEEDEKILAWVKVFGPKWTELSKALPGRTVDAIQSRYNKYLVKQ